jgi:ubiquinone/menaquinone biosynthesis C-methylase UbiE
VLFEYLASLVDRHEAAWDCATGNGQAAVGLARHFERVIATDISTEQIRHAIKNPRIDYRVAQSESCGLDNDSVDMVTVAAAVHWFDLGAFYAEVKRVLRPGGVLGIWTYHVGHVEPPFDHVFRRFYFDILRPFFAPQVQLVDEHYRTLVLPGESLDTPSDLYITAEWKLEQMRSFIMSWSGAQKYLEDRGQDPIDTIADELGAIWGKPDTLHRVRWPLFIRASRVG